MSGRRYDQSFDLSEFDTFKGVPERACSTHVRPRYL